MSAERVESALARTVGAEHVSRARPRFDAVELPLACPASVEEVAELVELAARERWKVVPIGLGSKLGWCRAPERADFLLSTRRLTGAVSHVPADGTISVRAGTAMAELAALVEHGGHRLTPDVPLPGRRTIGGVVAAGESGSDRLRFGPARHHVLGMQVVLGTGEVTRSGGQLVKNVTGFDLHRPYCGSHGTLCAIVEVSLRLFPAPERESWIATDARDLGHALERARAALALPIRPAAVAIEGDGGPRVVTAHLIGRAAAVEAEKALVLDTWSGARVLEGDAARSAACALRDRLGDGARPWLRATSMPSRCAGVLHEIELRVPGARCVAHPGIAQAAVELAGGADEPAALAELVRTLRTALARLDATLELRDAPSSVLVEVDPFGEAPRGLGLMRDLKRALDPDGVFASGRFVAGL